jgi:hypothetical protein
LRALAIPLGNAHGARIVGPSKGDSTSIVELVIEAGGGGAGVGSGL